MLMLGMEYVRIFFALEGVDEASKARPGANFEVLRRALRADLGDRLMEKLALNGPQSRLDDTTPSDSGHSEAATNKEQPYHMSVLKTSSLRWPWQLLTGETMSLILLILLYGMVIIGIVKVLSYM